MTKYLPMTDRGERGATTAEYSVGTIGTVFIAFWLSRLGGLHDPNNSWFGKFIHDTITKAFGTGRGSWIWGWLM